MEHKPRVGDRVRFNNEGLEVAFGHSAGLAHMKSKVMTLTWVDTESMTQPEKTYVVEVDDPEINKLLLSHWCFDLA